MASVILKNVWKKYPAYSNYGETIAVKDFNLDINDGEVIVFVGPSGCGKSTTLRMIAGLEHISEGEIYIDGKLMNGVEPKDRGINMVFQNYALFPHLTVFENIAFGLKPAEMPESEIKAKVDEIAQIIDVAHLFERMPRALSAGQKQRVALARALIGKSKVILYDEAMAHLDIKLRSYMRVELIKLHEKFKTTSIYITHNQEEAMAIADRLVVMCDGAILQVGKPEELYTRPCCLFVAGFLGTPQMNFVNTAVSEQGGDIFIEFGKTKIKLPDNKAGKIREYAGKEVIAGVRPEDMHADEAGIKKYSDSIVDTHVTIREFIGDRINLYCDEPLHRYTNEYFPLVIRTLPDCTAKSGDKIKVAVNPDKIHLFDKDTETAIVN